MLSIMEHHSNIVPWHFLRERQGAVIKWAPIDEDGNFLIDEFEKLLDPAHQDGGDHADVERARHLRAGEGGRSQCACARHSGAGGWQPGGGASADRRAGHRLRLLCRSPVTRSTVRPASACCGAKYQHLEAMPPFNGGGEMIRDVFEDRVTYGDPPHKFEAGTPPIVQAIGLGAAIEYVNSIGKERIRAHEDGLIHYAHERLGETQFGEDHRQGQGEGGGGLLRDEGRASARCRHHHRPLRRRCPGRNPLRDAAVEPHRRRPPHAGHHSGFIIPRTKSTRLARALVKAQEFFLMTDETKTAETQTA